MACCAVLSWAQALEASTTGVRSLSFGVQDPETPKSFGPRNRGRGDIHGCLHKRDLRNQLNLGLGFRV